MQKDRLVMHRPTQLFTVHNTTFYYRSNFTKAMLNAQRMIHGQSCNLPLIRSLIYPGPFHKDIDERFHCFYGIVLFIIYNGCWGGGRRKKREQTREREEGGKRETEREQGLCHEFPSKGMALKRFFFFLAKVCKELHCLLTREV